VLSSYSWMRGLDRMVDVALALKARGRTDVLFVMAGDMALTGSLPGALGRLARVGGTLADYAARRGVAGMFRFLGHVTNPEAVLAACDALAKPTREANPWGRDIIEALAAGRPVLTVGHYDRFVETGATGVLQAEFDAWALAGAISALADDRAECARLGAEGRARVARLCDPAARAADLASVWRRAAAAR
jgi:glycosyltransferase involved in cell wall biosynthesis